MKRTLHRWFVALGVLAMLMALVAIPAGIALASAKSDMAAMAGQLRRHALRSPLSRLRKALPGHGQLPPEVLPAAFQRARAGERAKIMLCATSFRPDFPGG